eukprot:c13531_g1_i1 orf=288-575(-)
MQQYMYLNDGVPKSRSGNALVEVCKSSWHIVRAATRRSACLACTAAPKLLIAKCHLLFMRFALCNRNHADLSLVGSFHDYSILKSHKHFASKLHI